MLCPKNSLLLEIGPACEKCLSGFARPKGGVCTGATICSITVSFQLTNPWRRQVGAVAKECCSSKRPSRVSLVGQMRRLRPNEALLKAHRLVRGSVEPRMWVTEEVFHSLELLEDRLCPYCMSL